MNMDHKTRLSIYLSIVSGLPEVIASGSAWIATDSQQGMRNFVVVPMSVKQLMFNLMIDSESELENTLNELNFTYSIERREYSTGESGDEVLETRVVVIEKQGLAMDLPVFGSGKITIHDLFKLALCSECSDYFARNKKSMTVEDSVFGVKNPLSIADDFMPHEIMGMVEGKFPDQPENFVSDLQVAENAPVFVLMKEGQDGFAGFQCIIPGFKLRKEEFAFPDLMEKLGKEIDDLSGSEMYPLFELSRILKTLIFQLEFKKRREIGSSLLSESKLAILREKGIIVLEGDRALINPELDSAKLKLIKEETDSKIKERVRDWHAEIIA